MNGFSGPASYKAYQKRKRRRSLWIFIFSLLLFTAVAAAVDMRLYPILRSAAAMRARAHAAYVIGEAVTQCLSEEGISYGDLTTFEKDNDGRITALKTDTVRLNLLKSKVTSAVYHRLREVGGGEISVPLGSVLKSGFFFGKGPKIKVSLMPTGAVNADFENVFETGGINQTNHRIMIRVRIDCALILPFGITQEAVETSVCAAESVIVGAVPEAFTDVRNYGGGADISGDVMDFGAHNYLD